MGNQQSTGYTDIPVESIAGDNFAIGNYIKGLSTFIKTCDTPMTISIQGDWGSGKTSMMNMIKEEIKDNVYYIWFNTWQYSQFNMGDSLSITFLNNLIEQLGIKDKEEERKKLIKTVSIFVFYV